MNRSVKVGAISAVTGVGLGLLLGYIPAHENASNLQDQSAKLQSEASNLQVTVSEEHERLLLSGFAVRAADVKTQAGASNYSVASSNASTLFTDLRKFVNESSSPAATQALGEVLTQRDRTIAGLAQANPAVRPLLAQIFEELEATSTEANKQQR